MSYGCMFILRNVEDIELDQLHNSLTRSAIDNNCGICFAPTNNLLLECIVCLNERDFIFEVCDSFNDSDASLLLSHDGYLVNGRRASVSLFQRLCILQKIASVCISFAEFIEIYLGEDTPFLPDYTNYRLGCTDIANVLYQEYQKELSSVYVPCVHLIIED